MKTERSKTTKTAKCKEMQNNKKKDKRHKAQKTIRYAKDSQIDKTTRKRGKANRCRKFNRILYLTKSQQQWPQSSLYCRIKTLQPYRENPNNLPTPYE